MEREELIDKIRKTTTRVELLKLLNEVKAELAGESVHLFSLSKMMKLCNPNFGKRYRSFTIPKKSGGERKIFAPKGNLMWMQLCLNEIFKAVYTPSPYAMGFSEGRSIVDNAAVHLHQNYVFNIDLKDFFPSIDQARVWKRLQLAPFNFTKEVANVVAGLCAIKLPVEGEKDKFRFCLPQGAPTSPLLTNAICDTLDRRLAGLAKRFGLRYSRYADDITFSSMHNVYQPEVYVPMLKSADFIVAPDFSTYRDYPLPVLMKNAFDNLLLAASFQRKGCNVVANVIWARPIFYNLTFSGQPVGGTICVSSNSLDLRDKKGIQHWLHGYCEAVKRLSPNQVIRIGKTIPGEEEIFVDPIRREVVNPYVERMRHGR